MAEIILFTGNVLPISQHISVKRPDNLAIGIANDTLLIFQSVNVKQHPTYLHPFNVLNLIDAAHNRNLAIRVHDYLELHHSVTRPNSLIVASFLQLQQIARTVIHNFAVNFMELQQSVILTHGLGSNIVLGQQLGLKKVKVTLVAQTLGMQSRVNVYKQNNPDFVLNG